MKFTVHQEGAAVGTVTIKDNKRAVTFDVCCDLDTQKILRCFGVTKDPAQPLRIGVLEPKEGKLFLSRTISYQSLMSAGCGEKLPSEYYITSHADGQQPYKEVVAEAITAAVAIEPEHAVPAEPGSDAARAEPALDMPASIERESDTFPEPEPESPCKPEPGILPEPEPGILPEPEPGILPEPEPETLPEPEPETLPEPEPETLPEPEPETFPEPEPETLPEPEPETFPEPEPEIPSDESGSNALAHIELERNMPTTRGSAPKPLPITGDILLDSVIAAGAVAVESIMDNKLCLRCPFDPLVPFPMAFAFSCCHLEQQGDKYFFVMETELQAQD